MITKPTRITKNSATLIDHIFTNNINIDSDHVQGILCCSISDHYGMFHVTCASCVKAAEENPIMKRDMSSKNIQKFISEINKIDRSCVTEIDDTQLAFTEFHEIFIKKHNCCFPFKKQERVYFNRKPWFTTALKVYQDQKWNIYNSIVTMVVMLQKTVLIAKYKRIVLIIFWDLLSDNITMNGCVNTNLIWESIGKWLNSK